ncbi:MAG: CPBP family intramembrane metalloprotease [Verrucomicrobia bacterium]|nr:CPBP family intramembrane metalloprotease [Verrucomicrobiota bacterium]
MNITTANKRRFILLWSLCILGFWSILPYIQHLEILPLTVSIWKVALLGTIQTALFFGLICWISFKILPKTDLHPFPPLYKKRFLKQIVYPALIAGILVGLAIFVADKLIFNSSLLLGVHPPFWTGALASLYGAVNEEVLMRLFLFTLVYFLIGKWLRIDSNNRSFILWSVNIFVALLFGIGHLPAAFKLISPSAFEIFRVLVLNGIAGVVFGWLYWSRGLWTAIATHFVADFMIHVFLI